jgi:hypothetical protein
VVVVTAAAAAAAVVVVVVVHEPLFINNDDFLHFSLHFCTYMPIKNLSFNVTIGCLNTEKFHK